MILKLFACWLILPFSLADFSPKTKCFPKFLQEYHKYQTDWIQIRSDISMDLIWVQTTCNQQTTKVTTRRQRAKHNMNLHMCRNIRIYHECEGRIEKYIPRITDWHHKACRVMTNSDPEGQIFLSYRCTTTSDQ